MNNSIHRISLDIHDTGSQVSISAKKGDTARSLHINLTENGKPYRIAEGCSAVFTGEKSDGNYLFNDCTIKDNVIVYDFTEQTVPVVGQVKCEIVLYDANKEQITSPRFDIFVEDVVYNGEEIISSDEANALISATVEAKAVTAEAADLVNEVEQKLANGEFDGKDADPQLFANAVRSSAEGEVVRVDDVSPVEHTVKVKVDHTDPTSVIVTRCGKNLWNAGDIEFIQYQSHPLFLSSGVRYTLTADVTSTDTDDEEGRCFVRIIYIDDTGAGIGHMKRTKKSYLTFIPEKDVKQITFYASSGTNFAVGDTATYKNIQLETGSVSTEFEEYKGNTYTPNADGTVEGITSLSPTMTLLTDTDGAVIHCEYNKDTNKALGVTKDGTVVSPNADFAEVAEWWDGNPNNEDRTGYFVCANVPVDGIVMKKATSTDDVKGVSILAPAFAGNYSKDKLDANGNLLPKYSYVAIIGFVPVIDNGTCEVGGRCMPDDNGCAIPSSNSMGYQVVNRIDENRVLIIIEPNGDMVQRIKSKINKLEEEAVGQKTEDGGEVFNDYENNNASSCSHAEGSENIAEGEYSHAEGRQNLASGTNSHAEGRYNKAVGSASHAEGLYTVADGNQSHAEGRDTEATGHYAHAEGSLTKAIGEASHSEGREAKAQGLYSHAEGYNSAAEGSNSHAEGNGSKAIGLSSHAEGNITTAEGGNSHAEGSNTKAIGSASHAEGSGTEAQGNYSHAEGLNTISNGYYTHAEGSETTASGWGSHAEGVKSTASGWGAHAEGSETAATGKGSHAGGIGTKAGYQAQTAIGMYNQNKANTLFEIGNGTSDTSRNNAFEVLKDGSMVVGGVTLTPAQITKLLTPPKKYELIDTITTTKDENEITFKTEPNGTPYNFEKVLIKMITKQSTANGAYSVYCNGWYAANFNYGLSGSWNAHSVVELWIDEELDLVRGRYSNHTNHWSNPNYSAVDMVFMEPTNQTNISSIKLSCGSVVTPAGTTFEIWGVRK